MSGWWGVAAVALLDALLWGFVYQEDRTSEALRRLRRHAARGAGRGPDHPPLSERVARPLLRRAAAILRRLTPRYRRRQRAGLLTAAGLDWEPELFDALTLFTALGGLAAGALLGRSGTLPGGRVGWAALAGAAGYLAPLIWVRRRGTGRDREFRKALPDALDVLVICLRAGLGLQAAVAEYARNASGVAGEAFRRYLADLALGRTPEEGLAEMARRHPGDDLAMVSAALGQGFRLGSPLADVLEAQASHFRSLSLRRAEEGARALSTRLVLPLVAFIFPQVFIIGLGPIALKLLGPGGLLR